MELNKRIQNKFLLIFLCTSATLLTISCSYQPNFSPEDITADVTINETRRAIEISPASGTVSKKGLLFYPGGLVDNHVYNEILADFAEAAGVTAVVVKMPANLAVFNINAGLSVIEDYPEIEQWVIAGHSLGGSMAAATVNSNRSTYKGLIFMDSYPSDSDSLKDWSGVVLSLYSSVEKIEDDERMEKTISLIPPATWLYSLETDYPDETTNYSVIHQIDGGSHSFFGTYGPQDGDYEPTITVEAFHTEVINYMLAFFTKNNWR